MGKTVLKAGLVAALLSGATIQSFAQGSCQTFGPNTYCSDGSSSQTFGPNTYYSDGSSSQRFGGTTYFNESPRGAAPPVGQQFERLDGTSGR
jgi:hypothetical protein